MEDKPLVLEISEVHQIRGVGTTVIGVIACDEIRYRDKVVVTGTDFAKEVTVGGVDRYPRTSGEAGYRGEEVGMYLVGDETRDLIPAVVAGMTIHLVERAPPENEEPQSKRPWWKVWT